ncbi:MAG: hypothetical protein K6C34_04155 [Alphaproteobacteria bacterium]|nr:hypothetical protein [Alphaproteobacteria bacterium]
MRLIDRCIFLFIAGVLFLCESLFSTNLADSTFYVFIFLSALSLKINLELAEISIVAIFADICAHRYVGISIISYVSLYLLTVGWRNTLRSFHSKERMYYFFLFLCMMKLIMFAFVLAFGGKFDIFAHLKQIVYSMILIGAYYICNRMWKVARAF